MKVSVIVPIYNVGSYIYQCVDSIMNQTYSNIEIILVIDGSTDDSALTCHGLAKNDKRIKVIEQPNAGLVAARKKGLESSTGEYILNVDGDDWIEPSCVELLMHQVLEHDAEIVIAGYYREFVGKHDVISPRLEEGLFKKDDYEQKIFPELISTKAFFSHGISTFSWGKLFKKSLLYDIQSEVPNQITVGEDTVVTYPAIVASRSIAVIHDPVYFYRQRAKSMLKVIDEPLKELESIKFMVNYLQEQLIRYSSYNFQEQIKNYIVALSIIRTGCCLDYDNFMEGIFPSDNFLDKKIILYSSGSFGQQIFYQLTNKKFNVIGWVDEDTFESNIYGLPVISIESIKELKPDIIIVATLDDQVYHDIYRKINHFVCDKIDIISPSLTNSEIKKYADYIFDKDL